MFSRALYSYLYFLYTTKKLAKNNWTVADIFKHTVVKNTPHKVIFVFEDKEWTALQVRKLHRLPVRDRRRGTRAVRMAGGVVSGRVGSRAERNILNAAFVVILPSANEPNNAVLQNVIYVYNSGSQPVLFYITPLRRFSKISQPLL